MAFGYQIWLKKEIKGVSPRGIERYLKTHSFIELKIKPIELSDQAFNGRIYKAKMPGGSSAIQIILDLPDLSHIEILKDISTYSAHFSLKQPPKSFVQITADEHYKIELEELMKAFVSLYQGIIEMDDRLYTLEEYEQTVSLLKTTIWGFERKLPSVKGLIQTIQSNITYPEIQEILAYFRASKKRQLDVALYACDTLTPLALRHPLDQAVEIYINGLTTPLQIHFESVDKEIKNGRQIRPDLEQILLGRNRVYYKYTVSAPDHDEEFNRYIAFCVAKTINGLVDEHSLLTPEEYWDTLIYKTLVILYPQKKLTHRRLKKVVSELILKTRFHLTLREMICEAGHNDEPFEKVTLQFDRQHRGKPKEFGEIEIGYQEISEIALLRRELTAQIKDDHPKVLVIKGNRRLEDFMYSLGKKLAAITGGHMEMDTEDYLLLPEEDDLEEEMDDFDDEFDESEEDFDEDEDEDEDFDEDEDEDEDEDAADDYYEDIESPEAEADELIIEEEYYTAAEETEEAGEYSDEANEVEPPPLKDPRDPKPH